MTWWNEHDDCDRALVGFARDPHYEPLQVYGQHRFERVSAGPADARRLQAAAVKIVGCFYLCLRCDGFEDDLLFRDQAELLQALRCCVADALSSPLFQERPFTEQQFRVSHLWTWCWPPPDHRWLRWIEWHRTRQGPEPGLDQWTDEEFDRDANEKGSPVRVHTVQSALQEWKELQQFRYPDSPRSADAAEQK